MIFTSPFGGLICARFGNCVILHRFYIGLYTDFTCSYYDYLVSWKDEDKIEKRKARRAGKEEGMIKKITNGKLFALLMVLTLTLSVFLTACGGSDDAGSDAGTEETEANDAAEDDDTAATDAAAEDTAESEESTEAEESDAGSSSFNAEEMIGVVSREDGSGTRGAFIELFEIEEEGEDGTTKDMTTEEARVVNKTDVMLTTVSTDAYAIGYVSMGSLNDDVKALDIEGVAATVENVKNGSYAIKRPFNIATKGEPSGLTKDFIDFIMSAEGQEVVLSGGCIKIDEEAPAYAGDKPEGKIVVGGSSSVSPVMEVLIEAYQEINPDAEIEMQTTDSTSGMTGTIDGTLDIGMASRDLKDTELEELTGVQIALDGIAVIVSKDNPVSDMTKDQVKQIFTGAEEFWSPFAKR